MSDWGVSFETFTFGPSLEGLKRIIYGTIEQQQARAAELRLKTLRERVAE